jgi:hypothetical protein
MMKKLFILFVILGFVQGFGQTYKMSLHVYTKGTATVVSDKQNVYSYTTPSSNNSPGYDYPFLTSVKGNTFTFGLTTSFGSCSDSKTVNKTLLELLKDDFAIQLCAQGSGFNGNFYPLSFIPEGITISNQNLSSQIVCAGEQVDFAAFPSGFPDVVYHWQYSLNNQVTWTDVPVSINNKSTLNSSITDIIGGNHLNYLGKQIYFRLGYQGKSWFINTIAITYSPCAPVIKDRSYLPPLCNGDPVQSIDVYFEKPLEPNEDLYPMQIIPYPKAAGDVAKFSQNPVTQLTFDAITGWYKYSFVIPANEQLENNKNYTIEYQARKNSVPRGVLTSSNPFLYTEPRPLRFTTKENQAQCFGGLGSIEITAWGGSGIYNYEFDGGPVTKFNTTTITTFLDTADNITKQKITIDVTTTTNPTNKNHSLRVTDDKDCFDKTVNE